MSNTLRKSLLLFCEDMDFVSTQANQIDSRLNKVKLEIITAINQILETEYAGSPIHKMISHYFSTKGKKLRPILSVYVYRLLKGNDAPIQPLYPLLSAIEIAHNASLIVDDILDKDLLRRGELSFFIKHGTYAALSIAYNLSVFVFELAARTNNTEVMKTLCKAASKLSSVLLISKDLESNSIISEELYMKIIHNKTSALFKSAAKVAALMATNDREKIEEMANFGENYGIAFQLNDDILAIEGSFEELGKPDSDVVNRIQSLITIKAMENASDADLKLLKGYYLQNEAHDPQKIRNLLITTGGTAVAKQHCLKYLQRCHEILNKFPDSEANENLRSLVLLINFGSEEEAQLR